MVTAIDTNILLDIFLKNTIHGEKSLASLMDADRKGALAICNIVYAELAPQFGSNNSLDSTLQKIGINVVPLSNESAYFAGEMWNAFRKKSKSRERIITDFLIGAFALKQADQFLTRDRGFYRHYFSGLSLA